MSFTPASLIKAERNFIALAGKASRQGVREALSKAALPVLRAARAKAPVDSGALRQSLRRRTMTNKKTGDAVVIIGPGTDFKKTMPDGTIRQPAKYAHVLEKGTPRVAARPFLRPAVMETEKEAQAIFAREVGPAIERVAERFSK